jgi:hypothetical protein
MKLLFTFQTVSASLDSEEAFERAGISCQVIPVPRAVSFSCNYAVTVETRNPSGLCAYLKAEGVEYAKAFRCSGITGSEHYEPFEETL